MKSCEVDLSDADVARLVLRFDEEESMRIDISQFMRFIRGKSSLHLHLVTSPCCLSICMKNMKKCELIENETDRK